MFKVLVVDPYSLSATQISIMQDEHVLGSATGFFWHFDNNYNLVTNWHVFSGRRPDSRQPIDKDGAVPNKLRVNLHLSAIRGATLPCDFPLFSEQGNVCWKQHAQYGAQVDVGVMQVPSSPWPYSPDRGLVMCDYNPVNWLLSHSDMSAQVGVDVFIIGFPLGLRKQGSLPIWKRGSIASEFQVPIDGLPGFLVDTATREGMSGSPVVTRSFGSYLAEDGGSAVRGGAPTRFLGIYSGRHVGKLDEAHLGIVWHASVLQEIIENGTPGEWKF